MDDGVNECYYKKNSSIMIYGCIDVSIVVLRSWYSSIFAVVLLYIVYDNNEDIKSCMKEMIRTTSEYTYCINIYILCISFYIELYSW